VLVVVLVVVVEIDGAHADRGDSTTRTTTTTATIRDHMVHDGYPGKRHGLRNYLRTHAGCDAAPLASERHRLAAGKE